MTTEQRAQLVRDINEMRLDLEEAVQDIRLGADMEASARLEHVAKRLTVYSVMLDALATLSIHVTDHATREKMKGAA